MGIPADCPDLLVRTRDAAGRRGSRSYSRSLSDGFVLLPCLPHACRGRLLGLLFVCFFSCLPWNTYLANQRQRIRRQRKASAVAATSEDSASSTTSRVSTSEASASAFSTFLTLRAGSKNVVVTALKLGGDLGRVRVMASRDDISVYRLFLKTGYRIIRPECLWREFVRVAAVDLPPHWDSDATIQLSPPVPIAAGQRKALFVCVTPPEEAGARDPPARASFIDRLLRRGGAGAGAGGGVDPGDSRSQRSGHIGLIVHNTTGSMPPSAVLLCGYEPSCLQSEEQREALAVVDSSSYDKFGNALIGEVNPRELQPLTLAGTLAYKLLPPAGGTAARFSTTGSSSTASSSTSTSSSAATTATTVATPASSAGQWGGVVLPGTTGGSPTAGAHGPAQHFRELVSTFRERVTSLDQVVPYIGFVNRELISEWTGRSKHRPLRPLRLPIAAPPPGDSAVPVSPAGLDQLATEHPALRRLWLRFLGGAAWAAHLREAMQAAGQCADALNAVRVLRGARCVIGDQLADRVVGVRWQQRQRQQQQAAEEQEQQPAVAQGLEFDCVQAILTTDRGMAESVAQSTATLTERIRPFLDSAYYAYYLRLRFVQPSAVSFESFSLLRLYGRGAYGAVYAARKEDTGALLALKVMRRDRVQRRRAEGHLRMERATAERAAGSPFLVGLLYAFASGPHLVLALPLLAGGTLQVHIEERAKPHGGLSVQEVQWIGAQLVLALEALHGMRILHRDVKPSNVLMRHDGYVALTDFGLCGELDGGSGEGEPTGTPLTGKTGTRGYWAPEVVRKEVQAEAADYWSLGVVLAYAATGAHPFHRRWVQRGEAAALDPPPPEALYVLAPAEEEAPQRLLGAIEEALSSSARREPRVTAAAAAVADGGDGQDDGGRRLGDLSEAVAGRGGDASAQLTMHSTPLIQQTPSTPASPAELRGISEEGMNYNTLHMPLEKCDELQRCEPPLAAVVQGLLTRDLKSRLGVREHGGRGPTVSELRRHPFFASVEWGLLAARRLPAPFLPSRELVYAKDFIAPLSQDEVLPHSRKEVAAAPAQTNEPSSAPPSLIDGVEWSFVCSQEAYREELAECAERANPKEALRYTRPPPVAAPSPAPPTPGSARAV